MSKKLFAVIGAALALTVSGCASTLNDVASNPDHHYNTMIGPDVTLNNTPYSDALICISEKFNANTPTLQFAVGSIQDMTGKFSSEDGGYKVTQGANLMVSSALSKMGPRVQVVERYDTSVFKFESDLANQKMLGDGHVTTVNTPNGTKKVNWRILNSGQVQGSDYYITGGITEVNYNIFSGGAEFSIAGVGVGARSFVMNVAVDLRLVDTRTLQVVDSISLQKQIVGYETKAGVFRFYNNDLYDVNAGEKSQEPLQLGVRSTLEVGVANLVANVYGYNSWGCINQAEKDPKRGLKHVPSAGENVQ